MEEREAATVGAAQGEAREKRSRRVLLGSGLGAAAALAIEAVTRPGAVQAAGVQLGAINSASKATTIRSNQASVSARAVIGRTTRTADTVKGAGVQGVSDGLNGTGLMGVANKGSNSAGAWGRSLEGFGLYGSGVVGALGNGDDVGVVGVAANGAAGVVGAVEAGPGSAVLADSQGDEGRGVSASATGADATAVHATASGSGGTGLYASGTLWAGYFDGDVNIVGSLVTPTAFVQTDHPDDPTRWYRQALVGSFERLTVLSGNVRTDRRGRAVVRVPQLFARTHRDVRYQLTPLGAAATLFVAEELDGARFVVGSDVPRVRVSWQLTGVRSDAAARRRRLVVTARKRTDDLRKPRRRVQGVAAARSAIAVSEERRTIGPVED